MISALQKLEKHSNVVLKLPNLAGLLAAKLGWMQLGPAPSLRFFLLRLMPVVACAAGSLYLGNLAYLSLSVAFIQILKVAGSPLSLSLPSPLLLTLTTTLAIFLESAESS